MSVRLRPATVEDVAFLVALVSDPEVSPWLAAVRPRDEAGVLADVERALAEPDAHGLLVIEEDGRPVGTAAWRVVNRRSRIAELSGVAIQPAARGAGLARQALALLVAELFDERGLHRLQLEVYGFNTGAATFFEKAGFVREGVRRKAYWREGAWVDGILFGLVVEDRGPA